MLLIDSLKVHLKILYFYGAFGNFNGMYKVYSVIIALVCFVPYVMLEVVLIVSNIGNLSRVSEASYLAASHLATTSKIFFLIANNKKIAKLLDQMNCYQFNPFEEKHKMLIQAAISHVQSVFKFFFGIANGTIFVWFLIPVVLTSRQEDNFETNTNRTASSRKLPFDWSNNQFDIAKSPNYEITYCLQILFVTYACHICVGIDCLVSGMLHMVATQFEILKREVSYLGSNERSCDEVQRDIKKCVLHHIELLNFTDKISSTFNEIFLTQCCVTSVVICVTALRMNYVTSMIEFYSCSSYIFCLIFQLSLYCHYGNRIFEKTDELLPSVYHSNWYLRECNCTKRMQSKHLKSFRYAIQMVMERAKLSTNLTAAKLFALDYATFVRILKTGYSFYAVCNSVK